MNEELKYADHYEIIIALVTYLALCNRFSERFDKTIDNATAGWLAQYLGFEEQAQEVDFVLENYKSLFRRSTRAYEGHYRYSLLLRYSLRTYTGRQSQDVSEPLSNDELFSLLEFISKSL